jgi:glycine oxidase
MNDCLVIGAGAVGLSLAYELARRGRTVTIVDRGEPGHEASWAGAGILPPANPRTAETALEQLFALSNDLHARWSVELREFTGIDNGLRRCGGMYLARTPSEAENLAALAADWRRHKIDCELLDGAKLAAYEPALATSSELPILAAYRLRDECQLRNPRHLKALVAACHRVGVEIRTGIECTKFETQGDRVTAAVTNVGKLKAAAYCVTSGAWTGGLLASLGICVGVKPIRGQIVLMNTSRPILGHVINEGPRYLVPRDDGRLLVGSTEEDVGFDARNTAGAVQGLIDFAKSLVPELAEARVEKTWAGLRPVTSDGLPLIGRIPGTLNAFCAAGHFRSGLQLSPGTAVVLAQLICGENAGIELSQLRLDRG